MNIQTLLLLSVSDKADATFIMHLLRFFCFCEGKAARVCVLIRPSQSKACVRLIISPPTTRTHRGGHANQQRQPLLKELRRSAARTSTGGESSVACMLHMTAHRRPPKWNNRGLESALIYLISIHTNDLDRAQPPDPTPPSTQASHNGRARADTCRRPPVVVVRRRRLARAPEAGQFPDDQKHACAIPPPPPSSSSSPIL